ncbi:hypothetical protein [Priestia megaterium]|uniref:hypothetical protein n=1 Tax=Priestia megaterium TaxID=1404 RepID=UPI000BFB1499|nr:hypothetical protein [Priestia megaterium]PGQ88189.1 hypothetical protein COA18_04495 [Priestia megaterium]
MKEEQRQLKVNQRLLELIALVSEDWGKVTAHSNDYRVKGQNRTDAETALQEIQKMQSPLQELEALFVIEIQRKMMKERG